MEDKRIEDSDALIRRKRKLDAALASCPGLVAPGPAVEIFFLPAAHGGGTLAVVVTSVAELRTACEHNRHSTDFFTTSDLIVLAQSAGVRDWECNEVIATLRQRNGRAPIYLLANYGVRSEPPGKN